MNILVCGDSHSRIFPYSNYKQQKYKFFLAEAPGGTAQGVVNPNSKSNALKIFENTFNNLNKRNIKMNKIIIMLGEVDCGFVIWVRSKRYNISVDDQLNCCVDNLFKFIKDVIISKNKYSNEDVIVTGAVLPTIKDSTDKKYLGGARSEVDVSQYVRTQKTLEYNQRLKDECEKEGYKYIDITKHIIGENNLVKNCYLHKNPGDHHLDNESTYNFWMEELDKVVL